MRTGNNDHPATAATNDAFGIIERWAGAANGSGAGRLCCQPSNEPVSSENDYPKRSSSNEQTHRGAKQRHHHEQQGDVHPVGSACLT